MISRRRKIQLIEQMKKKQQRRALCESVQVRGRRRKLHESIEDSSYYIVTLEDQHGLKLLHFSDSKVQAYSDFDAQAKYYDKDDTYGEVVALYEVFCIPEETVQELEEILDFTYGNYVDISEAQLIDEVLNNNDAEMLDSTVL